MNKGCEKYLEHLWNNIKEYNENINSDNPILIGYDQKNDNLYIYYSKNEKPVKPYPHINDFLKDVDYSNLEKIKSLSELISKELDVNNLNKKLFLKYLFDTLTITEKKSLSYSFTDIIYFSKFPLYSNKHNVSFLTEYMKIFSLEDITFLLVNMPSLTTMINKDGFNNIFKIINENLNITDRNEILLAIILKNKKVILNYKKQHITLRKILLETFNDKSEESKKQLETYAEHFPFILYSINEKLGSNYIEDNKNKECIFFEINAQKMIAYNQIGKWRINEYKTVLDIFFKELSIIHNEINSFNVFLDTEDKNDYLCINILKNDTNGITKEKIIAIIYDYFKDLKNVKNLLSIKDKREFTSTWLSYYHLHNTLSVKEKDGKDKVTKI